MSILKKLKLNKKLKEYIQRGEIVQSIKNDFISTGCIPLNILYSGRIEGGIPVSKISVIAGESGTSKSMQSLMIAKNAIKKGMEVIYIDTEYAINEDILKNFELQNNEKFQIIAENLIGNIKEFLMNISKEASSEELQNLLIIIDSWGMLTNEKLVEDAIAGKDVADLQTTRAKNNLAVLLNQLLPATIFISNHVYDSLSLYGGQVMSGGSKLLYVASSIVQTTSKAKDKDSDGNIEGTIVTAKTLKSRYCKPESKLKFLIKFDGGIHPVFNILEDALEGGYVLKPSQGWYSRAHIENDKKWRGKEIWENWKEFWLPIIKETNFREYIEKKYSFKDSEIKIEEIDFEHEKIKE